MAGAPFSFTREASEIEAVLGCKRGSRAASSIVPFAAARSCQGKGRDRLGPTFAELAGIAAPDFVDGRSLVPVLDGDAPPGWRDAILSELLNGPPNGGFTVLRSGSYAYFAYGAGPRELYDLAADPYQLDNIITSAPQALVDELATRFDALAGCGSAGPARCQQVDGGS